MESRLIMLTQPILCCDEHLKIAELCYGPEINNNSKITIHAALTYEVNHKYPKVIAGVSGLLPKLDLSDIAERIGWVDVERLALQQYPVKVIYQDDLINAFDINFEQRLGFIEGFKAAQSLNEKKYSEEDLFNLLKVVHDKRLDSLSSKIVDNGKVIDFNFWNSYSKKQVYASELIKEFIQSLSKPKEYNVDYIQEGNTIKVTKIL